MVKFAELEDRILASWKEHKIFEKTLAKPPRQGNFVFFEGPPTANGKPGLHHVLARAFKDLIPRYKTMQGFRVDRKAGWDTQGLPVELEVEKELKFRGKPDIEKYGIKEFNEHCRQNVWKYKADWEKLTERIGFWLDLEHPYITYEPYYIESLWWILKQVWETKVNGARLLYKDYKVVPHCPRCGTALSSHEVAQGYKSVKENSVYVRFRIKKEPATSILSWTTTPWTLPGNVALAVGKNIVYVRVKINNEFVILAKDRLSILVGVDFEPIAEMMGEDLIGLEYEPLFPGAIPKSTPGFNNAFKVYAADFVTTTDGTGVVHTAVMYGEDDFNLGAEIGLPKFHTVDDNGLFTAEVGEWAGKFVKDKDVEQGIVADLQQRGLLFKQEMYTHDYPYCWRCSTPLLYYAKPSWFIRMSALRTELKQGNEKINWYPGHIKDGRFGEWLDGAKDWAISRERYWGTPLPIWVCEKCNEQVCVGSFQELSDLTAEIQKSPPLVGKIKSQNFDPHRPFVDEIVLACKCGGQMKRVPEVADCWFDSGSMPFAQWGYPSTAGSDELFKEHYPAKFIAEAIDQTRGWFYTLLAIATLLKKAGVISEAPPYEHVICLGHINDKYGQKMSKSKGNVVDPWEVINQYGADALRWHFYTANQPGEPKNFDPKDVEDVIKKTFLILFNVVSFYELYKSDEINIDEIKLDENNANYEKMSKNLLDRWILAKWYNLLSEVTDNLEDYKITEAGRGIESFITDLSVWYVRRSRDRFKQEDKRGEALSTLRYILLNLSKVMSPFTPFLSEDIYRRLGGQLESVHLTEWPSLYGDNDDAELLTKMSKLRQVVEMVLAQRAEAKIKVRQALRQVTVKGLVLDDEMKAILAEEINVLAVACEEAGELSAVLNTEIDDELRELGLVREFSRQVNALRKQQGLTVNDLIVLKVGAVEKVAAVLSKYRDSLLKSTLSKEININQTEYNNKLEIEGEAVTVEIL